MSIPQFQDIFYPDNEEKFKSFLVAPLEGEKDSRIVVFPHASLEVVNELFKDAISHLKPAEKFLILAPSHSQKITAGIYGTNLTEFNSVFGNIKLRSFDSMMKKDEEIEKEYSFELTINALAQFYPSATYYPVLCAANSKKDIAELKALIASAIFDGFSIVISGNLTKHGTKQEIDKEAIVLTDMLNDKKAMLDEIRRGHISSCMSYILEALSVIPYPIKFSKFQCGSYFGDNLDINKGDGNTWFASGYYSYK